MLEDPTGFAGIVRFRGAEGGFRPSPPIAIFFLGAAWLASQVNQRRAVGALREEESGNRKDETALAAAVRGQAPW